MYGSALGGAEMMPPPRARESLSSATQGLLEQLQKTSAIIDEIETRVIGPHPTAGMVSPNKDRGVALLDVVAELRERSESIQSRLLSILGEL